MSETKQQTIGFWFGPYHSAGGPFIVGYSDFEGLDFIVAKIYKNDGKEGHGWHDLPDHLQMEIARVPEQNYLDEQSGALKSNLMARGRLNGREVVPPINILVNKTDEGKITKEINWPATLALWAGKQPAMQADGQLASAAGEPVYRRAWDEEYDQIAGIVAEETLKLGLYAVNVSNELMSNIDQGGETPPDKVAYMDTWKTVFYRISREFDAARGAHPPLVSQSAIPTASSEAVQEILDGTPETFGETVASAHPLIVDAEHAKTIFQSLGIKASEQWASSPQERLSVARQIWLYATLRTEVFDVAVATSTDIVQRAFDEIPW